MRPVEPVLVVGAGIAGLTAALALARRGIAARIVEQAEKLDAVGAGVQLSPNALRVLDELGILEATRKRAVEADRVELRDLRSGRTLARVAIEGADGIPYLSIHRADLQSVLFEAVREHALADLQLGRGLVAIRRDGARNIATILGPSNEREEAVAPALIAADGVHSPVGVALGHARARSSGAVAYRMTLPAEGAALPGIVAWLSAGCHVVAYPIRGRAGIDVVVVAESAAGSSIFNSKTGALDPFLARVAERMGNATVWPLLTSDRRRSPDDPPELLLIGDAAHAMLPYAAQGAALAMEDGFVAAYELSRAPDAATAWRAFEAKRRSRWNAVRRRVAFHRFVYHLPFPLTAGRNFVLARRSPQSLRRDLGWLYDWHPPV